MLHAREIGSFESIEADFRREYQLYPWDMWALPIGVAFTYARGLSQWSLTAQEARVRWAERQREAALPSSADQLSALVSGFHGGKL